MIEAEDSMIVVQRIWNMKAVRTDVDRIVKTLQGGIAEDGYSGNNSHFEEDTNVALSFILNVFSMKLLRAEP
jgi:hypothetical protein